VFEVIQADLQKVRHLHYLAVTGSLWWFGLGAAAVGRHPVPPGVAHGAPAPLPLQNEEDSWRKIRLRVEDVQGRNCLTNFWVRDTQHLLRLLQIAAGVAALSYRQREGVEGVHGRLGKGVICACIRYAMHGVSNTSGPGLHDRQAALVGAQVADAD
jgi:hypothetical protein